MNVLAPLVKTIEVDCDVERAFDVFTRGIDDWWPVAGHSLDEEKVESIVFESGIGGRILERWHDGTERSWGEISAWEPPHRIAFSWLPNPDTGKSTQIEVRFRAAGSRTEVTLEHRGWERSTDDEGRRANYDTGWDGVLGLYAESAAL